MWGYARNWQYPCFCMDINFKLWRLDFLNYDLAKWSEGEKPEEPLMIWANAIYAWMPNLFDFIPASLRASRVDGQKFQSLKSPKVWKRLLKLLWKCKCWFLVTSFLGFPLPIVLDITDQNVSDCHRDYHGTALGENIPWYSTGGNIPWYSASTGGNICTMAQCSYGGKYTQQSRFFCS